MEKKLIRLTEQDLHRIVKESVNNIISEIGRSAYTQKKYDQTTRNEIIANAQAEVDRLRAEIANLTKKIRVAQSPEAVEQLNRQRSVLYKLRNRAVAKVWNLSNERVMTQGAKERATVKRRIDKAKANFYPSYNTSTFTEAYIRDVVNESIDRILKEHEYGQMPSLGRKLTKAELRDLFPDDDYEPIPWHKNHCVADEDHYAIDSDGDPMR